MHYPEQTSHSVEILALAEQLTEVLQEDSDHVRVDILGGEDLMAVWTFLDQEFLNTSGCIGLVNG